MLHAKFETEFGTIRVTRADPDPLAFSYGEATIDGEFADLINNSGHFSDLKGNAFQVRWPVETDGPASLLLFSSRPIGSSIVSQSPNT